MANAADSNLTPAENPQIEKIRRELQRKSLDQIKCLNPFDVDREVIWDGFRHVVPANGERVLYRYLAVKYFRETTDWAIYEEEKEAFERQNKKRMDKGQPPMTPQEREQFDMQYGYNLSNENKRKEILDQLYGGLVEEYGLDMPTPQKVVRKDERTFEEKLLEEMEGTAPAVQHEPAKIEEQPQEAIEAQKDKLIKETSDGKKTKKNTRNN